MRESRRRSIDVRIWRESDGTLRANVRHLVHHSPAGFECGYGGSGPADLALSILGAFVAPAGRGDRVRLWKGASCSRLAWALHQQFKQEFIARLPKAGGIIPAAAIEAWVAQRQGVESAELHQRECFKEMQ